MNISKQTERTYRYVWLSLLIVTTITTLIIGEGATTILIAWISYLLTTKN